MSTSTPPPPPIPPHVYETPPPPPPKPNSSHASRSGTPTHSPHRPPYDSQPNQAPAIPDLPLEPFVPPILFDKPRDDLIHMISSPELLDALYLSCHPTAGPMDASISSALQGNIAHGKRLMAMGQSLDAAREATSVALMQTRSLERSWREKEKEMFDALNRFSAPALHARLGQAVTEADAMGKALEESFLDDDARGLDGNGYGDDGGGGGGGGGGGAIGKAGKDVENFVKNYRNARAIYHLRKERKERWDENRVGGWR